ncbi:MAG: DUF3619 family protein [Candidatus Accumulibacter sp.]|jgi:Protein of unknown function (DUF3619).|uniref:DUF3619 family protein n=1 Tax=Accumulibacter sp. TaxID=2053492 RepID=UPI001A622951|nr:DUF3619 family protein [Accumulibacter sp.]MBL8369054.1 DUF3619 family protein [Accumulibacter sp.]HRE84837.1 DUF3619 family protein [Accumulibacter sp.]
MNELHFAFKARQHLNRGLHELPPSTQSRLQAARERALARQKLAVHQSILVAAGSFVQEHTEGLHLRQILVALALVLGVVFYAYWQADRSIAELEVIDSALLADDLPIAAFTDRGFDAWLKSSASH